jgi:hypothetical protein
MVGCQMLQSERGLVVLVRDAETKQPLSSAEVYVCQLLKDDSVIPSPSSNFTQQDGFVRLRSTPAGENGVEVQAVAAGYLSEKVKVPADELKKITSRPPSAGKEPDAADVVVDAYAKPGFSVELIAPQGYRGLIEVEIAIREDAPCPKGKRCFQFAVPPSSAVRIEGPTLLQRVAVRDYRARYPDGPLLPSTLDVNTVGFRWLRGSGNKHLFLLGTQTDYETLHQRMTPAEQANSDSWEDASAKAQRGKYRYGYMTSKKEESAKR